MGRIKHATAGAFVFGQVGGQMTRESAAAVA
jgi:hypothetical protein